MTKTVVTQFKDRGVFEIAHVAARSIAAEALGLQEGRLRATVTAAGSFVAADTGVAVPAAGVATVSAVGASIAVTSATSAVGLATVSARTDELFVYVDDRLYTVTAQNRAWAIGEQNRTLTITQQGRSTVATQ